MTTLYGGPMPPDFTDGEQLTATAFNAVKNYWIIEGELPLDGEDGDVVFSVGDVFTPELPGVGGWATILEVESPDIDVPIYTDAEGIQWKTYIWENPRVMTAGGSSNPTRDLRGSITLADEGLIELIVCAGGGSGFSNAGGGGAGGVIATVVYTPAGKHEIYVGSGSQSTGAGGGSSVGPIGMGGGSYRSSGDSGNGFSGVNATTPGAGAIGSPYLNDDSEWEPGPGITLNWADGETDITYGLGGQESTSPSQPPGYGTGGTYQPTTDTGAYYPGANGVVLIRVPLNYSSSANVRSMSDETKQKREVMAKAAEEQERNQPVMDGEE